MIRNQKSSRSLKAGLFEPAIRVRLYWMGRLFSVLMVYVVGAIYYHKTEDWTVMDSAFFVTVSVATIGYGDFHPTTDANRIFTSFFLIMSLVVVLSTVDDIARFGIVKLQSVFIERYFPQKPELVSCNQLFFCFHFLKPSFLKSHKSGEGSV
jgi:hypothetical protein